MKIEKVTCNCVSETPSCAINGFVNSVHTYCGLEMAIMQTSPRMSCIHLLPKKPVVWACCAAEACWAGGVFMIDHLLEWEWICKAPHIPVIRQVELHILFATGH